jgi:hypothetical protein
VTTSLTRGWGCLLQLLLVFDSAFVIRSEPLGTHCQILLSQIEDSPNLEGQRPVFISFRKRLPLLYPKALGSLFVASYELQGYGGGTRPRLHKGDNAESIKCPPFISSG